MGKEIVVYSTPLCAPCEQLKKFLREEGIEFEVKDLMMDQEAAELMEERGVRSAPALSIEGKILFGPDLNAENLRKELNL
jgi:glutaredoxin-like protein NrdH